ncbi:DNA-binding transcriptional regulator CytR [Ktedonobacter sp. SOSP1-52]|uniref:LacI family DNA-binding transcriptional regulator n=1 Tax=Ktedonobacter sp. SOSP1-52 TaxID=2778366 RepID=UPI001915C0B1|nr:LacI family DNA-binding transcriptional regulator [Ktedonobacter sp. SOSP1-52]GHO65247.1 DNA-binding transcriptional regulator CytR [Ktedonobacter sp. SOSP1-52]
MTTTKLIDVARTAGVSPTTVSRVLNNTGPVNEGTRARVLAVVAELGYKPISGIRPQPRKEQRTIALVISDILNPFFPEIVRGVEDEAGTNGLTMLLCNTSEDPQREAQALTTLIERQVDGIIVCASRIESSALVTLYEQSKIPLVIINKNLNHPEIPCVLIDFENAAYRSTQHLLRLNHTRIAYLAGNSLASPSLARRRGIEMALRERNRTLQPEWCPTSFPNVEGGFQAMSALLSRPRAEQPTAVIAYNDIMALGALHAIRTYRLRVPDDISVVGCDGIAMAAHSNPPLTTIDQPKYRMGQLAMQMLRLLIEGRNAPSSGYTLMESPLIVRESTAPCVP